MLTADFFELLKQIFFAYYGIDFPDHPYMSSLISFFPGSSLGLIDPVRDLPATLVIITPYLYPSNILDQRKECRDMKGKEKWIDFTKYLYPSGLVIRRKVMSLIKKAPKEKQKPVVPH
jgi:hypothetical protein